jgi:hypothetical protein
VRWRRLKTDLGRGAKQRLFWVANEAMGAQVHIIGQYMDLSEAIAFILLLVVVAVQPCCPS